MLQCRKPRYPAGQTRHRHDDRTRPIPATHDSLDGQVALVLAAEGLGRSHVMEQLLRFLLARAQTGRAPKEIEIAEAVFARPAGEGDADSSVRSMSIACAASWMSSMPGRARTSPCA
jgi:hypothetical protein